MALRLVRFLLFLLFIHELTKLVNKENCAYQHTMINYKRLPECENVSLVHEVDGHHSGAS